MSIYIQWRSLQRLAKRIELSDLKVLYQRDGLMAIHKPYGLPVHRGPKVNFSLVDMFPEMEKQYNLSKNCLHLANRLDKNTSGVLLLTYNQDMANHVAELFKQRSIRKKYLAILIGHCKSNTGVLSGSFSEQQEKNQYKQLVDQSNKDVQTSFKVIDRNKKSCMLCAFETHSGFRHQIRAHVSQMLDSPILGDHKYHPHSPGPQRIPLRIMQMLGMQGVVSSGPAKKKIQPWQRGLVPMHLVAQHVLIPGLDENGTDLKIATQLPDYFQQSMESCGLMFGRAGYEEEMAKKRKKKPGQLRDSIFVPKGVYVTTTGQATSF